MSALLNVSTSAPLSTVVKACREGEWDATIDDGEKWISFKEIKTKDGDRQQLVVFFNILSDTVRKEVGREKVLVPKNIWLDCTESGTLDMTEGKNVDLGRLLEAAGLNTAGPLLERVNKLRGRGPFKVKVTQRSDPNDSSIKYAEVKKVTKIST